MKNAPLANVFIVPNEVFILGLHPTAFMLYFYLLYREDRKTYTCFPSYRNISQALGVTKKTVSKYVGELVDKGLIETRHTHMTAKDGTILNGNLEYHLLPLELAIKRFYEEQAERGKEEQRIALQRKLFEEYQPACVS